MRGERNIRGVESWSPSFNIPPGAHAYRVLSIGAERKSGLFGWCGISVDVHLETQEGLSRKISLRGNKEDVREAVDKIDKIPQVERNVVGFADRAENMRRFVDIVSNTELPNEIDGGEMYKLRIESILSRLNGALYQVGQINRLEQASVDYAQEAEEMRVFVGKVAGTKIPK